MRKMATLALTFILVLTAFSYRPAATHAGCITPPSNMVSWWPGDGNANDIVVGNNGTPMNHTTFALGMVGQAFNFDGTDDHVTVPDLPLWDFDLNDFSIDFWINLYTIKNTDFISHDDGPGNQNKWIVYYHNGLLQFHINSPTIGPIDIGDYAFSPNIGKWYHIAVTKSGSIYTFYLNGVIVDTTIDTHSIPRANNLLHISSDEGIGTNIHGLIDEVEIFNRALSATEILSIYNAGSAGKCKPYPVKKPSPKLPSLSPLASTNIAKAKTLLTEVNDLLQQAKTKGADTSSCEKLIGEAKADLAEAKMRMASPITANYYALKAMARLTQAIDCLKALLG